MAVVCRAAQFCERELAVVHNLLRHRRQQRRQTNVGVCGAHHVNLVRMSRTSPSVNAALTETPKWSKLGLREYTPLEGRMPCALALLASPSQLCPAPSSVCWAPPHPRLCVAAGGCGQHVLSQRTVIKDPKSNHIHFFGRRRNAHTRHPRGHIEKVEYVRNKPQII
jgi:hypothetical protein